MKRSVITAAACVAALAAATPAYADLANGPDPYAPAFGFDAPDDGTASSWGGWTRGDAGTVYAEWDTFSGSTPNAPDVGVAGTSAATFGWNAGTFPTGSGNLYNFSSTQIFTITVDGGPGAGPISVALQTETWGTPLEQDGLGNPLPAVTLNGAQWDAKQVVYEDAAFASTFGEVLLQQVLFTWTLDAPAADYVFELQSGPHTSFAQAAVDIGASPVPLPAGAWLLGSAVVALGASVRRRAGAGDLSA